MSIQTRTTAVQNEVVRLECRFEKDGKLSNPLGQPMVEIIDTDGVTVIDTVSAGITNTGEWHADWYVPANLPLGDYYDRWTFQWDAHSSVQELTFLFTVHGLDSYINFLSPTISHQISNRAAQLMIDLSNDFIYESMHIPVYFEQGMRIQQEDQQKRIKSYYYFTLDATNYQINEGDVYYHNGQKYTVFQYDGSFLSTSSSSSESANSESSSSSIDSSSSTESSSSTSIDSSSTSSAIVTTTTTTWSYQPILTCVGTGDPNTTGTLSIVNGTGSPSIGFTGYSKKTSKFSTRYNFAYKNWNKDPRPIAFLNGRIVDDGWFADYDGNIFIDRLMAPEDSINMRYTFAYFSEEEILGFLRLGLCMMNSIPPASETYSTLEQMPPEWNCGVLLYAAITALKRLIFGLNFQEKMIIFWRPDAPDAADKAIQNFKDLYQSYQDLWVEYGKNVKTRKLPGIAQYVTPEYTLPGGRSRWFRYLYKTN